MQFPLKYKIYKDILKNKNSLELQSKIKYLVSNLFVYKFPPILHWPEGISTDIPVEYIIAIRKMFEHCSILAIDNVKEICFSKNSNYSSYGDKIIIIPIEYTTKEYDKQIFLDVFAHELGHSLGFSLLKNNYINTQIQVWHSILTQHTHKHNRIVFFSPNQNNISKYQFEDYKEFFSECYSQILNHYEDLVRYVLQITDSKSKIAYLMTINFLLNYVLPFSKKEKEELIDN